MRLFLWIFGVAGVANGVWMLLGPEAWYNELPAGVPDTGPLNLHFVRDIGAAFTTFGLALCIAAEIPRYRRAAVTITALFYGLHALIHVFDLIGGRLPAGHWLEDLPGVFAPAVLLAILSLPRWWHDEAV
jgi:hypothetical protein